MKLIGAGMPRTGTLTQRLALEALGLGPSYHMVNVLGDLQGQVPLWDGAMDGSVALPTILDGYESTVDWPGGFFYRRLIDDYPDAKVLLSVRDPERWEPSFTETIVQLYFGESLLRLLSTARGQVDPKWQALLEFLDRLFWSPQGTFPDGHDPQSLIDAFIAHTEEVKRVVPSDRLLVWDVSEGWEPLCAFLGLPVPSQPFPRSNDREEFIERIVGGAIATLHGWHGERQAA